MIKGLLPTNWYHATVRDYEKDKNGVLTLLWTIDTGEFAWRNLKPSFDPELFHKLEEMCSSIGFTMVEEPDSEWFGEQFIGLRARLSVDRYIDGKFVKNRIIEYAPPQMSAEYNVLKEQTDDHFFANPIQRELPF